MGSVSAIGSYPVPTFQLNEVLLKRSRRQHHDPLDFPERTGALLTTRTAGTR